MLTNTTFISSSNWEVKPSGPLEEDASWVSYIDTPMIWYKTYENIIYTTHINNKEHVLATLAAYMHANFKVRSVGNYAQQSHFVGK